MVGTDLRRSRRRFGSREEEGVPELVLTVLSDF